MGSQIQKTEQIDLSSIEPPLQEYKLSHCGYSFYVWQHILQNQSLIEFPINIADNLQLRQCLQSFFYRHRHHLLVSSLYFKRNQANRNGSVFYERVFTNLGRIKDIPFIDALMFYYVGLKGFQLLYKKFGYFQVEEYMFHITKSNKVKIWPHKDISKNQPIRPTKTPANPESDMIKKIITIIEYNSDNSNNSRFPLASTLYQQASNSFSQAIKKFREICHLQNFIIPEKLACLNEITKGQTGQILDQYGDIKAGLIYTDNREQQATVDSHIRDNLHRFTINNNSAKMNETPVVQLAVFQQDAAERRVKTNKKQLKKTKGIQIARSLDKKNNQSSLKVYEQSKENSVQFMRNMGPESPIKFLQNSQKNNFPVQIKPNITSHHQAIIYPSSHYQYSGQSFYTPNGRVLVNNNIPHMSHNLASHCLPVVATSVYPKLPIQNNEQFKRKNSFSYLSHQNSLSPEYRVVVHSINRPGSNIAHNSKNYPNPAQLIENYRSRPISPFTPNRHFPNIPSIPSSFNQVKQAEKTKTADNNGTFTQYLAKYIPKKSLLTPPLIKTEISQAKNNESEKNVDSASDPKKIKHRETFISNLSEFQKFDQVRPLAQNANLKSKFEEYKKSFNFEKRYSQENESSNSQLLINGIKSVDVGQKQNINHKPFFGGILTTQTVKSCIGSDTYPQHKINEINLKSSNKINNASNPGQFPSVTDVSDNISAFQNKENEKGMRCQSVVISHDPMQSKLKMPTQGKKYEPEIDQQIWADMMKARNKQRLMGIEG